MFSVPLLKQNDASPPIRLGFVLAHRPWEQRTLEVSDFGTFRESEEKQILPGRVGLLKRLEAEPRFSPQLNYPNAQQVGFVT